MKKNLIYSIYLIVLIFHSGCSIWNNFTTYFNRYYNASLEFSNAEEVIKSESKRMLFEFKEEQPPSKARQSLDKVIEKCSKILQFDKQSAYFDDALLMIGKAFYLQGNFTKALRKFRELEPIPNTDLSMENKLWLGKSEMQMRNFEGGYSILEEVKQSALEVENNEIAVEAYLSQIRYMIYQENYSSAIDLVQNVLELSDDNELNAEIIYELGNLYYLTENLEDAVSSYQKVGEFEPSFDTEFESKIKYASVQREMNNYDESRAVIEELREEDKYKEDYDRIDLEKGLILYETDLITEALDLFNEIDTLYKRSESSGIASFMIAELFEKKYGRYDTAKVLYDKAIKSAAPVEYKDLAKEKAKILKRQNELTIDLSSMMKQLIYVQDTSAYKADSTAYDDYFVQMDSLTALIVEMKELQGEDFDSTEYVLPEKPLLEKKPEMPTIDADSIKTNIANTKFELGNLYFTDLEVGDSAFVHYNEIIDKYPNQKLLPKVLYALGSYHLTIDDSVTADSLFLDVYQNYDDDEMVNAAAERLGLDKITVDDDPAEKLFLDAEDLYWSDEYNQAIDEFYNIADIYPESPFAAKSLLSAGWILEHDLELRDSAAVVYDSLSVKYKDTQYASSISRKLLAYKQGIRAIEDSLAKIEQAIKDSLLADSLAAVGIPGSETDTTGIYIDSTQVIIDTTNIQSKQDSVQIDTTNIQSKQDSVIIDTTNIQSKQDSVQIDTTNIQSKQDSVIIDTTNIQSKQDSVQIDTTNIQSKQDSVIIENNKNLPDSAKGKLNDRDRNDRKELIDSTDNKSTNPSLESKGKTIIKDPKKPAVPDTSGKKNNKDIKPSNK
ncbi:tetratricopeptide repeat protein [Bacteroidota bacterium]